MHALSEPAQGSKFPLVRWPEDSRNSVGPVYSKSHWPAGPVKKIVTQTMKFRILSVCIVFNPYIGSCDQQC